MFRYAIKPMFWVFSCNKLVNFAQNLGMRKILLVDNNDSFTYNLVEVFRQTRLCHVQPLLIHHVNLSDIALYDAVVISPGPGLPDEKKELKVIIETCLAFKKSLLGVCLGHQAIIQYFGGTLKQLDSIVHGESTEIEVDTQAPIFKDLVSKIEVGRYHSWVVDKQTLPEAFDITSYTNQGLIMSVKHRHLNINGVQFHPESILTPKGQQILKNWIVYCVL